MLPIKGLEKTSFIDFSPYTVSTIFIGGCNFRCGFCHNPTLITSGTGVNISEEMIISFLRERKKWIDGVCITGGEPTLYPEIISFISKLKSEGMLVKLDTNGTNPDVLKKVISQKLVDYIAMDIKNSKEKYSDTAGVELDLSKVIESIGIIRESGIDYEFRTTVVPGFHDIGDIGKIAAWLKGSKRFVLQKFRSNVKLLDPKLEGKEGFSDEELEAFVRELEGNFDAVELKN